VAHFGAGDLPGEAQPVGKAVGHPVGGELGRQEQVERAGLLAERAELDRLDPLAVELLAQVLAQALADVSPVRSKVEGFLIFHHPRFARFALVRHCLTPAPRNLDPIAPQTARPWRGFSRRA
jgi:hypothetical protein